MLETANMVRILGMIGVQREAAAGAAVSVFGGGINPGAELPAGIDPDYILEFARAHEDSGFDMVLTGYSSSTPDGLEVAGYAAAHTKKLAPHRPPTRLRHAYPGGPQSRPEVLLGSFRVGAEGEGEQGEVLRLGTEP